MLGEIDLDDAQHRGLLIDSLAPSIAAYAPPEDPLTPFGLREALDMRRKYGEDPQFPPAPGDLAALDKMVGQTLQLWDGALVPGSPWQPTGEVGYMLAWMGLQSSREVLDADFDDRDDLLDVCDRYVSSMDLLDVLEEGLTPADAADRYQIAGATLSTQLSGLLSARADLSGYAIKRGFGSEEWPRYDTLYRFATGRLKSGTEAMNIAGGGNNEVAMALREKLAADAGAFLGTLEVPDNDIRRLRDPDLRRACLAGPRSDWSLTQLGARLRDAREDGLYKRKGNKAARYNEQSTYAKLYLSKVHTAARLIPERYPDLGSALADGASPGTFDADFVTALGLLRVELAEIGDSESEGFLRRINTLLDEHFKEVEFEWRNALRDEAETGAIDWELIAALQTVDAGVQDGTAAQALDMASTYLDTYGAVLVSNWSDTPDGGEDLANLIQESPTPSASSWARSSYRRSCANSTTTPVGPTMWMACWPRRWPSSRSASPTPGASTPTS